MNGVAIGLLVASLGAVGLLIALAHRQAMLHVAQERAHLHDWQTRLELREERATQRAQEVDEFAGRLIQVAVCGCEPHTLDLPSEDGVRPDRTPPRGPRPGRPPTRRG